MDTFTELTTELTCRRQQYEYYRDRLLSAETLAAMDGKPVEMKRLGDVLNYEQPTKYLVSSKDYSDDYATPRLNGGKDICSRMHVGNGRHLSSKQEEPSHHLR